MNLSKLTTSPKLLFVLLSQCGDLCLNIIYIVCDVYSWRWLTCFFLTSVSFPFFLFRGERYWLFVTHDCKNDLWTPTVQFERIERNIFWLLLFLFVFFIFFFYFFKYFSWNVFVGGFSVLHKQLEKSLNAIRLQVRGRHSFRFDLKQILNAWKTTPWYV